MTYRAAKSAPKHAPYGPFAPNLVWALHRARLTRAELADKLADQPRRVSRLTTGSTEPLYREIPSIADALGVAPEHLAWLAPEAFKALYPVKVWK